MEKCYISGPITKDPLAREKFQHAARVVRRRGLRPVNPFDLYEGEDYKQAMRCDIAGLLECTIIYLLHGWEHSPGARLEFAIAQACGLSITYQAPRDYFPLEIHMK